MSLLAEQAQRGNPHSVDICVYVGMYVEQVGSKLITLLSQPIFALEKSEIMSCVRRTISDFFLKLETQR